MKKEVRKTKKKEEKKKEEEEGLGKKAQKKMRQEKKPLEEMERSLLAGVGLICWCYCFESY